MVTLATVVPGLSFWVPAHWLVGCGLRLGVSYALWGTYMGGLILAVFLFRETLLAMEFGTQPGLFAPALTCLAATDCSRRAATSISPFAP